MKRLEIINPKVSIILAVYNRESLLERCLNSVLVQDYENWELVVVDDGSEDDSLNLLLSFSREDARIKVIHQNNEKLARSRNNGIMFSSGKYVTFLDSDDEYLTSHLSKRIRFMEDSPGLDLIHGGVKVIGNQFVRDKDNPHNFIHLSECCIGATFFGKRDVFTNLKGFNDLEYSEDSDFLIRAENKFYVKKVNFITYIYHRENSDSLTHNYSPALKTAEE
jgi:glycosyltransferase involved in cell wall biosynthesis